MKALEDDAVTLVKTATTQLSLHGNNIYSGGTDIQEGIVRIDHDRALGFGNVVIAANARLQAAGLRRLENSIVNQGVIAGSTGGEVFTLAGDISGAGGYEGNVTFDGTFRPGNSPALISAEGNLTFSEMNTLIMEIAGLTRGVEYDALDVSGILTLGGRLEVILLDGFVPLAGQSFQLFEAALFDGHFSDIDFTNAVLGSGLVWDT